jgi:hypothetical protein
MSIGKNLSYIPQQKLIDYVRNPDLAAAASIPAAAALFELQQRVVKDKELAALKAKEAMAQGPQSVADKTIAASQPQGLPAAMNFAQNNQPMDDSGVASLDTGDMYQEQNFAGGGIVAFDNGGDVDLTTRSRFDTLTDEEKQVIAAQYGLGADLGNQRGSIGAEYAGIVNQQGVSAPRGELRGRYMTDEGNQYNARYMPDARALSVDRDSGRSSVGADVAPGPDNSMGLRSIRGSYITDDGTRYGAGYNVDSRQALLERINQEGSRLGITASPDSVGVQGQYNFAQGGEVKHYAYGKGVKTDPELYDPFYYKDASAALVPTRNVPTASEYFKDQRAAETELGIDPDYVKNRMKDIAAANETETDSAKRMANANMLFAMSDALSSTPGSLLKGLSRAAPAGLKAGTEALKDLRELEKTKREAQNKLNDAEYSQKRGDAQGYMKNINEYKTLNANIEMKNAELETSMRIANYKARAEKTTKGYEIYDKAVDNAQKAFDKDYPDAALTEATGGDAAKLGLIRKQYIERELKTLMGNIEGAYGAQPAVAQAPGETAAPVANPDGTVTVPGKGTFKKLPNGNYEKIT